MAKKTALILSGGGARGAYQVGVLKGFAEILQEQNLKNPFQILSGTSAGAINTAKLAASPDDFKTSVEKLVYLWSQLKPDQVFNVISLGKLSLTNFLGGAKSFNSILDTAPLKKLIESNCNFEQIQKNLDAGTYESVIITANNYIRSSAVSFIQTPKDADQSQLLWKDSRRVARQTQLNANHILASAAIPMLFPPVTIEEDAYGDGCVRNNTPCSPSIRMGAEKLFVIGVRAQKHTESLKHPEKHQDKVTPDSQISMIRILNTLLNAVLLDSVEQDVQRIQRVNQLVDEATSLSATRTAAMTDQQTKPLAPKNFKKIPALCISPSRDIGELAREGAHHLPRILRMTLSAFGSLDEASEIISYLMFDSDFCRKLIEIGYQDALDSKVDIVRFLEE